MSIKYQLKRSKKRKTLAIKIKENQVLVYAPNYLALNVIEQWLTSKQDWIEKHLSNQQKRPLAKSVLELERVTFMGKTYSLVYESDFIHSEVMLDGDVLRINTSKRVKHIEEKQLSLIMQFAAQQLTSYCEEKAAYMANKLKVNFQMVSVKHIKSRWGSCDTKGRLQFNLQLASAPLWVIDYVIAHEVAHLQVMDHSHRFWQVVKMLYPEHKKAESWLKENGFKLDIFKV